MTNFNDAMFAGERHHIFPLAEKSKKPLEGDHWPRYLKKRLTVGDFAHLWGAKNPIRYNIGIICANCVVVDADSKDAARELYRRLPKTDMMTKTPRGAHFFYKTPDVQLAPKKSVVMGIVCDMKTGIAYVLAPGSKHPTGKLYERVGNWNWIDVPEFDPDWIESPTRSNSIPRRNIENVGAYLMHVESVQGKNGSKGLVRAASICRDAGYSEAEAMVKLLEWNRERPQPPWSEAELARAVTNVYRKERV